MAHNRSNSDPSDMVERAPIAPMAASAKDPIRNEMMSFGNKCESGFVGLANQGATCYLNSLIQCLYMTPEFRNALFTWRYRPPPDYANLDEFKEDTGVDTPTVKQASGEDESGGDAAQYDPPPEYCIPYQLQCLFARLTMSARGSVSTKPLTKSFHWDDAQSFQQHDVQELMRVLFDAVDRSQPNFLSDLCRGSLLDYLDCQTCHTDRFREDHFLDLSLVIEKKNSLQEALDNFVEPEIMTDGNQVNCAQCGGKQDFKKGLKISSVPRLLFIQLKRFYFDWNFNRRIKLGHRVAFPEVLDMSKWISTSIDDDNNDSQTATGETNDDSLYQLYGIIIQSGGALGGHYYAYIRSFESGKWYDFNDSSVREMQKDSWEQAFGGDKVKGTGYVLAYRRKNLPLPDNYDKAPTILHKLINKEDAEVKKRWEEWQKEMRSITLSVHYCKTTDNPDQLHTIEKIKVDTAEVSFAELHRLARQKFAVTDSTPLDRTRLRRYYPDLQFKAEGFDDANIADSKIEIAKWKKNNIHLLLEALRDSESTFEQFDPNHILLRLFVVTNDNMEALVVRGFVQAATFAQQELPEGSITSLVVDASVPMPKIKPLIYAMLKKEGIMPNNWSDDPQKINLIRFGYNNCKVYESDTKSLRDFNVGLGDLLFVERQTDPVSVPVETVSQSEVEKPDTIEDTEEKMSDKEAARVAAQKAEAEEKRRAAEEQMIAISQSELAQMYEEQRLKITVSFNKPIPVETPMERIAKLVELDPLRRSESAADQRKTHRVAFDQAVRISKEKPVSMLKEDIARKLGLNVDKFRLRKARGGMEYKDMSKTLRSYGIGDNSVVYVEHGLPTRPDQLSVSFTLYDPLKKWSDPWKRKKTLYRDLFEYPFSREMLVKDMKVQIMKVVDEYFPPYEGKYTLLEAVARRKEQIAAEKKAAEEKESSPQNAETEAEAKAEANPKTDTKPKSNKEPRNLFATPFIRVRKLYGASIQSFLFDDRKLCKNILQSGDIKLAIERSTVEDYFTDQSIAFWIHRYRTNIGGAYGQIFRKREMTINKQASMLELKKKIAGMYTKEELKAEHISLMRGWAVTSMNAQQAHRLQWGHHAVQQSFEPKPDQSPTTIAQSLLTLQLELLASENDQIVNRPPFHLRNGDVIVWTDITEKRSEDQQQKLTELENAADKKKNSRLTANKNFKGGTALSKFRREAPALKILTHEEWQEEERRKQLEKEQDPKSAVEGGDTNPAPVKHAPILSGDDIDSAQKQKEENRPNRRKMSL